MISKLSTKAIRHMTDIPGWLQKTRAANKKAAFAFTKNLKDPEFLAATKIMKYKKKKYYG
jgi:hypothetical protein